MPSSSVVEVEVEVGVEVGVGVEVEVWRCIQMWLKYFFGQGWVGGWEDELKNKTNLSQSLNWSWGWAWQNHVSNWHFLKKSIFVLGLLVDQKIFLSKHLLDKYFFDQKNQSWIIFTFISFTQDFLYIFPQLFFWTVFIGSIRKSECDTAQPSPKISDMPSSAN